MKKSGLIILLLIIQQTLLLCQNPGKSLMYEWNILASRDAKIGLTYSDITGSPYDSDSFKIGTVRLSDSTFITLPLRYDLYTDEIEFRRDETIYWVPASDVDYVVVGKDTLVPEPSTQKLGKFEYYFVKEKGRPYSLYIKKKVNFEPKAPAQAYTDPKPNRFERAPDTYYFKKKDEPAVLISSRRELADLLEGNKPALDLIRKSRIRINETDLTKLVRFLNHE